MKLYWDVFWSFFRIGILTFGGGYAMMPMLQKEVVDKYGWGTTEELLDYFSLSQCLPGIIAVNVATFVGTKIKGVKGAVAAAIGVTTPSLIIITLVAVLLQQFTDLSIIDHAFAGIRIAVCALILNSVIKLGKSSLKTKVAAAIFVVAVTLSVVVGLSPIIIVVLAAAAGVAIGVVNAKHNDDGEGDAA